MSKKKILLITHQTSKTGAPISILLTFKDILKKKKINLDVFALSGNGDLRNDFEQIANTFYSTEKYYGYKKTFYEKILSFFNIRSFKTPNEIIKNEIKKNKYDIIYANTVVSIPIAIELNQDKTAKIIAHIHELNHSTIECLPDLKKYIDKIDLFFVPSIENKELFINEYNVQTNKIELSREATLPPNPDFELNICAEKFNVYMCGTANWRKGDDLFLILANSVIQEDNNIHFYWIGTTDEKTKKKYEIEFSKLNTKNNIHFLGETNNIYGLIKQMNCFVLTSREDPFPLAAVEAGMAGLPIICFNKGNGIKEVLIDKDLIIDYLDLEKMKKKILELKNNSEKTKIIGENNKQTFYEYTPEKISEIILKHL
jgi:hypothetical protein